MNTVNRIRNVFQVPRKGETFELRSGLVSQYAHERKDAIQRTIMAMTLGKDVSALFPDVLKNIATPDLDQKKLVYLYLMNYAKSHPDLCILAVNTFVQDSEDPNPLVRALAIRTMGCIRVDKMVDYMEEPLRKTLKVVANSVTALAEIQHSAPETGALTVSPPVLKKLLLALNECTEWGRITILTQLAEYHTTDLKETEHICERVVPQFQHVNPSVVISAIKVVFAHMKGLNYEVVKTYMRKMAPPLVTLLSSAPEVQYVALRNINLLLQKQPDILSKEMRVFFCKYNDPPYVKLEKLEIMIRIANDNNVDQLLMELKEYALEVDMDFVRRAVKAIGQCAIKIESAKDKCVNVLMDLINTKVNYVVQEAIVVIKDILRKYPGYEGIIPQLCQSLDELDEPSARGSLIWIVGEYAEKINNADEILTTFIEGLDEEETQVQLQLLTATVKLFLKKPQTSPLVQKVLQAVTTKSDNPDLRDRAFIYWRLLSNDPALAKTIILADKPPITSTIKSLPAGLLEQLLSEISTLASVYHKPPETFVGHGRTGADALQKRALEEAQQNARENPIQAAAAVAGGKVTNVENLLDIDFDGGAPASASTPSNDPFAVDSTETSRVASPISGLSANPGGIQQPANNLDDLLGVFGSDGSVQGGSGGHATAGSDMDILGGGFGGMNLAGSPPAGGQQQQQGQQKQMKNEDILGLF
ncbi:hypothetical protein AA313_de0205589 [Arthrobotrys entomopaga]|nr:hypothetical protein AA313_de0205589 [Arthrobotrys entomopaga]